MLSGWFFATAIAPNMSRPEVEAPSGTLLDALLSALSITLLVSKSGKE